MQTFTHVCTHITERHNLQQTITAHACNSNKFTNIVEIASTHGRLISVDNSVNRMARTETETRGRSRIFSGMIFIYSLENIPYVLDEAVALLAWQRTCDSQAAGSSPGWATLRSGLGQATYTCVPLSPSSNEV